MHFAARWLELGAVRLLLEHGADTEAKSKARAHVLRQGMVHT